MRRSSHSGFACAITQASASPALTEFAAIQRSGGRLEMSSGIGSSPRPRMLLALLSLRGERKRAEYVRSGSRRRKDLFRPPP